LIDTNLLEHCLDVWIDRSLTGLGGLERRTCLSDAALSHRQAYDFFQGRLLQSLVHGQRTWTNGITEIPVRQGEAVASVLGFISHRGLCLFNQRRWRTQMQQLQGEARKCRDRRVFHETQLCPTLAE